MTRLLELINSAKLQERKSIAFTHNEPTEKEIRKPIPFTIASHLKYVGISITEEIKDIYNKNYNTLKKEIGEGIYE